jgi:hypothetical protein
MTSEILKLYGIHEPQMAPPVVRQVAPPKYQLRRGQSSKGVSLQDPVRRSILPRQYIETKLQRRSAYTERENGFRHCTDSKGVKLQREHADSK